MVTLRALLAFVLLSCSAWDFRISACVLQEGGKINSRAAPQAGRSGSVSIEDSEKSKAHVRVY